MVYLCIVCVCGFGCIKEEGPGVIFVFCVCARTGRSVWKDKTKDTKGPETGREQGGKMLLSLCVCVHLGEGRGRRVECLVSCGVGWLWGDQKENDEK